MSNFIPRCVINYPLSRYTPRFLLPTSNVLGTARRNSSVSGAVAWGERSHSRLNTCSLFTWDVTPGRSHTNAQWVWQSSTPILPLSPPSPLPTHPSVSRILQTGGGGGRPEIVVREAIRLWDRVIWSVSSFEILPTLFRSDLLFSKCMSKHIAIQAGDLESISTINGTNAARRHTSSHSSSEYVSFTSLLTSSKH